MSKIDYAAIAAAGGIGKGPTRKEAKAAKRVGHKDWVAEVRAEVFRLDPKCVVCLGPPTPDDAMHEVMSRAQTRGLPDALRFNRRNCVRVHDGPGRDCHRKITGDIGGNRTTMEFLDATKGVDGGLVIRRAGHPPVVYRRGPKPKHEPLRESPAGRDDRGAAGAVGGAEPGGVPRAGRVRQPVLAGAAAVGGEGCAAAGRVAVGEHHAAEGAGARRLRGVGARGGRRGAGDPARREGSGGVRHGEPAALPAHADGGPGGGGDAAPERPEPPLERGGERPQGRAVPAEGHGDGGTDGAAGAAPDDGTRGDTGERTSELDCEATMVGMPVRHVRAAALVEPLEDTRMESATATTTDEARGPAEVINMADKVQKPVKQPTPRPKPREGAAPVTKAEDGEAPPPQTERLKGERRAADYDKQRVKLLIATPLERTVVDKALALALEAGTMSPEENDAASKLLKRSEARRW